MSGRNVRVFVPFVSRREGEEGGAVVELIVQESPVLSDVDKESIARDRDPRVTALVRRGIAECASAAPAVVDDWVTRQSPRWLTRRRQSRRERMRLRLARVLPCNIDGQSAMLGIALAGSQCVGKSKFSSDRELMVCCTGRVELSGGKFLVGSVDGLTQKLTLLANHRDFYDRDQSRDFVFICPKQDLQKQVENTEDLKCAQQQLKDKGFRIATVSSLEEVFDLLSVKPYGISRSDLAYTSGIKALIAALAIVFILTSILLFSLRSRVIVNLDASKFRVVRDNRLYAPHVDSGIPIVPTDAQVQFSVTINGPTSRVASVVLSKIYENSGRLCYAMVSESAFKIPPRQIGCRQAQFFTEYTDAWKLNSTPESHALIALYSNSDIDLDFMTRFVESKRKSDGSFDLSAITNSLDSTVDGLDVLFFKSDTQWTEREKLYDSSYQ